MENLVREINRASKAAGHVQHDNIFYLTGIFDEALKRVSLYPNQPISQEFTHTVAESLVCSLAILKENKDQQARRLFNLTSDFVLTWYYHFQTED